MKVYCRVIACVIAWFVAGFDGVAISSPPPTLYCIFSPAEPGKPTREPHFQLMVRGKAYFEVLGTQRRTEDKKVAVQSLFDSTPEWVFKLEKVSDDLTRIKLRGAGGYLSADYETTPPTVVERPEPDESSNWRIILDKRWRVGLGENSWHQQAYIQNVGRPDQKLWLSIDAAPILAHHPPEKHHVREYRKAVLTDTKTIFEISTRPISK